MSDAERLSEEEIERRKRARTGRRAERVTAAPGEVRGDKAEEAATASEDAEEQK